jgi:hypothetical protein
LGQPPLVVGALSDRRRAKWCQDEQRDASLTELGDEKPQ